MYIYLPLFVHMFRVSAAEALAGAIPLHTDRRLRVYVQLEPLKAPSLNPEAVSQPQGPHEEDTAGVTNAALCYTRHRPVRLYSTTECKALIRAYGLGFGGCVREAARSLGLAGPSTLKKKSCLYT